MKNLRYIYILIFVFFFLTCERESKPLQPCANENLLSDISVELSSYLEQLICPQCEDNNRLPFDYWTNIMNQNTGKRKVDYYEAMVSRYLPHYSSMLDTKEIEIYTTEYVLSLNSVLATMDSSLRNHLLSVVVRKQRTKFGVKDTAPSNARKSGILLILSLLQYDNADIVLNRICAYCSTYQLNNVIQLSDNEEFNKFLVNEILNYLSNRK